MSYEGQPSHTAPYLASHGMTRGMPSWPPAPVVYNLPASQGSRGELYYLPQPMGLPAAVALPYTWHPLAYQPQMMSSIGRWQGMPVSNSAPDQNWKASGHHMLPSEDRRNISDEKRHPPSTGQPPRGPRQYRGRSHSQMPRGVDRSSASSVKESPVPGSPAGSTTSSMQSGSHRPHQSQYEQKDNGFVHPQDTHLGNSESQSEANGTLPAPEAQSKYPPSALHTAENPQASPSALQEAVDPKGTAPGTADAEVALTEQVLAKHTGIASAMESTQPVRNSTHHKAALPPHQSPRRRGGDRRRSGASVVPSSSTPTSAVNHLAENSPLKEAAGPVQPQKSCMYFLRTGTCDYGDNCKFAHPEAQKPAFTKAGLPIRPGKALCAFHEQYNWCGFAKGCKFSHQENWQVAESKKGEGANEKELDTTPTDDAAVKAETEHSAVDAQFEPTSEVVTS